MGLKAVVYKSKDGWEPVIEDESGMLVASSYPLMPTEAEAQNVALAMLARVMATATSDTPALLGSMVLELTDMIDTLTAWSYHRTSRLAIAAASLSQARRSIEQAIREMQEGERINAATGKDRDLGS